MLMKVFESNKRQVLCSNFPSFLPWHSLQLEPEVGVLHDIEPGEECMLLEHHAAIGTRTSDFVIVQENMAIGRSDKTGHQVQQCGLTATGGAQRYHKIAVMDGEIDPFERMDLLARTLSRIDDGDVLYLQGAHGSPLFV